LLIGLYMLPGTILALPGGLLGRSGDKRLVVIGLVPMTTGGLLAGLAESYSVLIAGWLVSGIGAILLNVLMTKMINDWFAGREIVLARRSS
jgi:MFS family permease